MPSGVGPTPGGSRYALEGVENVMVETKRLNKQEIAALRLLSARGVVSQDGLVELLGTRPVFDGKDVGTCLQKLKEMGLVEAVSGSVGFHTGSQRV